MSCPSPEYPRLRPLEAVRDARGDRIVLRDPYHLAAGMLVVDEVQLTLLAMFDGSRGHQQIQGEFARKFGQILLSEELEALLGQLNSAGYLEGAGFDAYYEELVRDYREAPHRALRDADSYGVPAAELHGYLDDAIRSVRTLATPAANGRRLTGIVVPHLDFERGLPCYGVGYLAAGSGPKPRRVVVLGTNHFGRSQSVVATDKDFQTPWGVVRTDRDFLRRLEADCGGNLQPYPLDHLREHSVELQAVWAHHVFGDDVRIVPFLIPDPSGARGTAAGDPDGVDVREFSRALGELIRRDPEETLVVASADLSHVGRYFGDQRDLTDSFLAHVRKTDEAALGFVDRNDPEGLRAHMAGTRNPTKICSVGCLYSLMVALGSNTEPQRLHYHQAVTHEIDNAVTCAAFAFYE